MKRLILKNGLTVIIDKRPAETVTSMLTIKTGSNFEDEKTNGISHVIEHCVFNGTKKRNTFEIANEIESLGGELNAATTPERTFFYTKTLPKHLDVSLDILSDVVFNPKFPKEEFEKEKQVVSQEISMVYNNYDFYQWVVFQKALFKGAQGKPVYGSKKNVLGFSLKDIKKYYNRYYVPQNIILTLSGKIPVNTVSKIKKYFDNVSFKKFKNVNFSEEKARKRVIKKVKLPVNSVYMVLGYEIPKFGTRESYVFDIIEAILSRGQSGRLFNEIRNKQGLAYSVGAHHYEGTEYNFFAAYANTQLANFDKVKDSILKEFDKLQEIDDISINEAKKYLEGSFIVSNEDGVSHSTHLGTYEILGDAKKVYKYLKQIKSISREEIVDVAKRYLNKNYCLTALVPKG
jgi:predicted Zn-dependent peptidase